MAFTPEQQAAYNAMTVDQQIGFQNWAYTISTGAPAPASVVDGIVKDWARAHYGALAAYLDNPELGPLLMQAGKEAWTPDRLQAAIAQTNFWKTTSASQREWDLLTTTDQASAQAKVAAMTANIKTLLNQEGVAGQYTDARITELATQLLRNGSSDQEVPKLVLADVAYNPTQPVGKFGATITGVKQLADQYLLPVSDQTAFDMAKMVETGQLTQDGVAEHFRQVAKGQFGEDIAAQIDKGLTARQALDPQIQRAAQLLEVNPTSIDFTNPQFAQIVSFNDGQQLRAKSLAETDQYVRGLPAWKQTTNANQQAAQTAEQLTKLFGATA